MLCVWLVQGPAVRRPSLDFWVDVRRPWQTVTFLVAWHSLTARKSFCKHQNLWRSHLTEWTQGERVRQRAANRRTATSKWAKLFRCINKEFVNTWYIFFYFLSEVIPEYCMRSLIQWPQIIQVIAVTKSCSLRFNFCVMKPRNLLERSWAFNGVRSSKVKIIFFPTEVFIWCKLLK